MSTRGSSNLRKLLSPGDMDTLWYYKIGFAIWWFVNAVTVIILSQVKFKSDADGDGDGDSGTDGCTWLSTTLDVTSDYRTGGGEGAGGKDPASAGIQFWGLPEVGAVGPVNLGLLLGVGLALEFLWLVVQLFFHEREMYAVANDHNPFRWWRYGWSHGIFWLAVAITAGVPNVYVLTLLTAMVVIWLFFFSVNEAFNSVSVNSARVKSGGRAGWMWYDAFVAAILVFIVTAVIVFIHLGFAASNTAFDVDGAQLATAAYVTPIAAAVIYLALPVIIYLHHSGAALQTVSDKERAMYWFQFVFLTVVTWLSLAIYTAVDCTIEA